MSDIVELFRSTAALYARFEVEPTLENTSRRFFEEVCEFKEACDYGEFTDAMDLIADEAADVLVTTIGMLLAAGVGAKALQAAIERVIVKNDSKTHTTHELVNGKITRKAQS